MTLHDFLCLLIGGGLTGLACAAIYAAVVAWADKIAASLRGRD